MRCGRCICTNASCLQMTSHPPHLHTQRAAGEPPGAAAAAAGAVPAPELAVHASPADGAAAVRCVAAGPATAAAPALPSTPHALVCSKEMGPLCKPAACRGALPRAGCARRPHRRPLCAVGRPAAGGAQRAAGCARAAGAGVQGRPGSGAGALPCRLACLAPPALADRMQAECNRCLLARKRPACLAGAPCGRCITCQTLTGTPPACC